MNWKYTKAVWKAAALLLKVAGLIWSGKGKAHTQRQPRKQKTAGLLAGGCSFYWDVVEYQRARQGDSGNEIGTGALISIPCILDCLEACTHEVGTSEGSKNKNGGRLEKCPDLECTPQTKHRSTSREWEPDRVRCLSTVRANHWPLNCADVGVTSRKAD